MPGTGATMDFYLKKNKTITHIRHGLGLSQPKFAKLMHVSVWTVRRWDQHPDKTPKMAMALATIYLKVPWLRPRDIFK